MTDKLFVGETETLVFSFYDENDALADPTDVTLQIQAPDGTITSYVYSSAELTNESTGVYTKDIDYDAAGIWLWEVETTGAIKPAVSNGYREVLPQMI